MVTLVVLVAVAVAAVVLMLHVCRYFVSWRPAFSGLLQAIVVIVIIMLLRHVALDVGVVMVLSWCCHGVVMVSSSVRPDFRVFIEVA